MPQAKSFSCSRIARRLRPIPQVQRIYQALIWSALSTACGADSVGDGTDLSAAPLMTTSASSSSYSGIYDDADKWLCRPGLPNNPCTAELTVTEFLPDGKKQKTVLPATRDDAAADCFYLYATVDPGLLTPPRNLDFPDIDRASVTELMYGQARPFRGLCNIYAPLYRQVSLNTFQADDKTRQEHLDYAYRDVSEAFDYLLAHTDPQRPIVLLSHSQGSHHTIRLLKLRFEKDPALRKRLVVAVLAGPLGGFWVPRGETSGGALEEIPLCTSAQETGCALTFNTYLSTNPPDDSYGSIPRSLPDSDVDLGCNPGFYSNEAQRLRSAIFVTRPLSLLSIVQLDLGALRVDTDYARYPDLYTGRCLPAKNGLSYLSLSVDPLPGDRRKNPVQFDSLVLSDPSTGLHALDYAFVSDDLVEDVRGKLAAHAAQPGMPPRR